MIPEDNWPQLWEFFMVLHEDWRDDFSDEDSAMRSDLSTWSLQVLETALRQWHEAFDGADDARVSEIVGDFNPSYDPGPRFGGDRGWAEWVREHLERELARRTPR